MNIKQTYQMITAAFAINRTPHLIGLHGLGKSSVVKQWCDANGYTMIDVRLGQMADAGDIIGLPEFHTDENGKKSTKYVLPDFFPRQPKTVIFLDEINRASKDLLQAVFELVYDKSLKGNKLPDDCHIIAASNPATDDYAVLDFSDSAFQDRFIHSKFVPTTQEFFEYAGKKFPNSSALEFLKEDDKCLEDKGLESFQLDFVKPSRRSWENGVMPLEKLLDEGKLDESVFWEMVMGIVGMHATPAYATFKKTHVGSIKAKEAIENYKKVRPTVLKMIQKERSDILGQLVVDIGTEIGTRKGLTKAEANNLIALVGDLTPDSAYTLCTLFTQGNNHEICGNVDGMPGGLLESDELEAIMMKTNKLREEAAKEIEAAKTAPKKKSKKAVAEEL